MSKQATLILGMLIICALLPQINAEPLITGIFYDPDGVDTGFEWVELYNPTAEAINLEDYVLVKGNGASIDDWSSLPQLSGTVLPQSFFLIGETNVSNTDLQLKLALFNGPDALALRTVDNETVEVIGYGTLAFDMYYSGSSTIDVTSGKTLSRKFTLDNGSFLFSQTNNNSQDWQSAELQPRNSLYQYVLPLIQNTSVTLVVPALPVIVKNATLADDQPSKSGTQWSLVGKKRIELRLQDESASFNVSQVQVSLLRSGVNRLLAAQVQSVEVAAFENETYETIVVVTAPLTSDLSAGNYTLQVSFGHSSGDTQQIEEYTFVYAIELLPSIGMTVCDTMSLVRETNAVYRGGCTITNIGNVPAYVGLNLTFDSDIPVMPYFYNGTRYVLLTNATLLLAAGESRQVEIVTNVSRLIPYGSYDGILQVRAWATE